MNIGNIPDTYSLLLRIADYEDPLSRTVAQTLIANKDLIMLKNKLVFDANTHGGGALGDLPEWDLSDLYTSEDAPELLRDLNWLKKYCTSFIFIFLCTFKRTYNKLSYIHVARLTLTNHYFFF